MSGTARVWALTALLVALAVGVALGPVAPLDGLRAPIGVPWLLVAAGFGLAEVYVAHLQFRRNAHSFSLAEVPLVIGLFYLDPSFLVLAQLVGATVALTLHRRQSPLKLVFNLAHFCLEAGVAVLIFHTLIDPGTDVGLATWGAAFLAAAAATLIGVIAITAAISLSEGRWDLKTLPQSLGLGILVTLTNTSLGLVGAVTLWRDPRSAWLLLVPTGVLIAAYRAYSNVREKHDSLEFLYESTRQTQGTLELEAAVTSLLTQARKMFRAEVAGITLFPENEEEPAVRTTLGPGDKIQLQQPVKLEPTEGVWARVASERQALLIPRPITNDRLRSHFAARDIFKDAMVAPLFGDELVVGTLLVGDRLGDVSTFDEEDLRLFETLANHASVSLQNARLVDRLKESLAHLTEMNQLKDDFVAAVSHELRTPLTSIQGYIKTLLRPEASRFDKEQQKTFLEAVDRQSDRLRDLIEDLLVVSRLEAHKVTPLFSTISLAELTEHVLAELRERTVEHQVVVDLPEDLPAIKSDQGKIHQILSNLVDNACKYTPKGTTITVKAWLEGEGVTMSVIDTGEGIEGGVQDRVFDRFYQVDQSSTRKVGGTGLGLYICRRLADALGGRVWLERSDPTGSEFSLWVPRTPPSVLEGTPLAPSTAVPPSLL